MARVLHKIFTNKMNFETLTNKFPEINKFPRQMFESIMDKLELEFPAHQPVWDNFVFVSPKSTSEEGTTRVKADLNVMIVVDNGKYVRAYSVSELFSMVGHFNLEVLEYDDEIIMDFNNATKRYEMLKTMKPNFEKGHCLVSKQKIFSYTVEYF